MERRRPTACSALSSYRKHDKQMCREPVSELEIFCIPTAEDGIAVSVRSCFEFARMHQGKAGMTIRCLFSKESLVPIFEYSTRYEATAVTTPHVGQAPDSQKACATCSRIPLPVASSSPCCYYGTSFSCSNVLKLRIP